MVLRRNYTFVATMIFLASLTAIKYKHIRDFKNNSVEYTFMVEGDKSDISSVKSRIQSLTYQSVDDEMIEEGLYRLTVRCPPDNLSSISSLLSGRRLKEDR